MKEAKKLVRCIRDASNKEEIRKGFLDAADRSHKNLETDQRHKHKT